MNPGLELLHAVGVAKIEKKKRKKFSHYPEMTDYRDSLRAQGLKESSVVSVAAEVPVVA